MIGAIIGDIVGSEYEFNNTNRYDFKMFGPKSCFTDDTVCSLAIAYALLIGGNRPSHFKEALLEICPRYPYAGYGRMFFDWLFTDKEKKPYNSFGNGAAMRISAVGWVAKSAREVKQLAHNATCVTHNHPEGIKGASIVAMMIYLIRKGKDKAFLWKYATKYYNLNPSRFYKTKEHGAEICQITVPQALHCFFVSESFEDCLRLAVSMGGDSDTLACIACAMAEAYYGVPEWMKEKCYEKLTPQLRDILKAFERQYCVVKK